jgi:glycosyltransferase involved in cell wall biosynthesis
VWGGDPQLRPAYPSWIDAGIDEIRGAGWGHWLVALPPQHALWLRCAEALRRHLTAGRGPVVVVRAGAAALFAPPDALVAGDGVTFVDRAPHGLDDDGLAPAEADLVGRGRYSTALAAFGAGGHDALAWLVEHLDDTAPVGRWFERMAAVHGAAAAGAAAHVAGWHAPPAELPVAADLDDLDPDAPWSLAFGGRRARVRLSLAPVLADAVARAAAQTAGAPTPLCLPGGMTVDASIRRLVADALAAGDDVPDPFTPAFLDWLETPDPPWGGDFGRYWRRLRLDRPDLQAAFPQPDSADQERFRAWITVNWRYPGTTALLGVVRGGRRRAWQSAGHDRSGVNLIGYHGYELSLGHVARRLRDALEAADVPVAALEHHRTGSPRIAPAPATTETLEYATNLAVVNADQFDFLVADHGREMQEGRSTVAYWFWELEDVPATMVDAARHVDAVWVGSRFVGDAFRRALDKPVHVVPIPIDEPQPSARDRASFGIDPERFVFLVTLDHFSVTERKNPFGAIEAFRRAFRDGEGPLLVVKTVNGDARWQHHERVLLAAAGRSDIVVLDEHLSRPDQMAVHAAADCLVSLHRSEGLGLHCAEAMWLGKPVIATRYSGNLDFMDDGNSLLVDAALVPVRHGEGVYPPSARWAEPDLDQAAAHMRAVVADEQLRARLGHAARQRMRRQPTLAATGGLMRALAGLVDDARATRRSRT